MSIKVHWRRVLWITVVWVVITNGGACNYYLKTGCNPLKVVSCEP